MSEKSSFIGFSQETIQFFQELSINNSKEWFEENKPQFEQFVKMPAQNYVNAMGEKLREISPDIIADPRPDKSIFRIYRDTRFSKDKSPYKTHLGILFWEGERKKTECSGYYFHVEPPNLFLGAGLYIFPSELLEAYRQAITDAKKVKKASLAISKIKERGNYKIEGEHYKNVPKGYDKNDPNANLLKYNGIWASVTIPIPKEFYSEKLIDVSFEHFKNMAEIHDWLVEFVK